MAKGGQQGRGELDAHLGSPGDVGSPQAAQVAKAREQRIDLAIGGACALLAFILYRATACPTIYWYDSAEFTAAAAVRGIPHAPGYPTYVLIGHLFSRLSDDPAWGVNLMSGVFGALAVGLCYGVARALGVGRVGAVWASTALTVTGSVWSNATVAEVYTPGLSAMLGVWWLTLLSWRTGRLVPLVAAAALAGVGLGLHLSLATTGLGLAWLAFGRGLAGDDLAAMRRWLSADRLRERVAGGVLAMVAAMAGASVFLWLIWRSWARPPLMFEPVDDLTQLSWMMRGGEYSTWRIDAPWLDLGIRLLDKLAFEMTPFGLLIAVVGLGIAVPRNIATGVALVLGIAGNLAFFADYGVHDVEVFFLPATTLLWICAGLAIEAAAGAVKGLAGAARPALARWLPAGLVGVTALIHLKLFVQVFPVADHAGDTTARDYGEAMCEHLPPRAVMLTMTSPPEWYYDAVFGMYFLAARGCRDDVEVIRKWDLARLNRAFADGRPVFGYVDLPSMHRSFRVTPLDPSNPASPVRLRPKFVEAPAVDAP